MAGFKTTGFDKLQKQLKDMESKSKQLSGKREVSFKELFTPAFMTKNTRYRTLDDLFKAAGFNIESEEDFEKLPQSELDAAIKKLTEFKTWDDFIGEAATNYYAKRMGF